MTESSLYCHASRTGNPTDPPVDGPTGGAFSASKTTVIKLKLPPSLTSPPLGDVLDAILCELGHVSDSASGRVWKEQAGQACKGQSEIGAAKPTPLR